MRIYILILSFLITFINLKAQIVKVDSLQFPEKKEGNDRNVMLNAASTSEPREIQIGLPDAGTYVRENSLPAVYYTNPQALSTNWRSDLSLEKVGLVNVAENAITTGNIGYGINSIDKLGGDQFQGAFKYFGNQYNMQQFDVNVSGPLLKSKGLYYSASVFQSYDPGSFNIKFTDFQDQINMYKIALTKVFNNNKGKITFLYKNAEDYRLTLVTQNAPFIYVGNGNVKQYKNFKLGTSSYAPVDGSMTYMNIRNGRMETTNLRDASLNRTNEYNLLTDINLSDNYKLKINAKYMRSMASMVYQTPMGLTYENQIPSDMQYYYEDTNVPYVGDVQSRMSALNRGFIDTFLLTSELSAKTKNHNWRIGLNEWYYNIDYSSNTTMYNQEVAKNPRRLRTQNLATGESFTYYDYNRNASEYYKGFENRLALYGTDNWAISDRFNLYYGLRLEYYKLKGKNLPYERYTGFHLGDTHTYGPDQTETIQEQSFDFNWLNTVATVTANYVLMPHFGLTGEFTYNTQRPHIDNFAGFSNPSTKQIKVPMARVGIYLNNDWIQLTSMFTWIQKTNNYTRLNLINPANESEIVAKSLNFDIETLAWTTDLVTYPFKNFDLHFLFTYQKPKYKKYETSAFGKSYNFTGNIVTEIPQVLIELDPKYQITPKLSLWASFRYFSKTYANLSNALYFNGRWETFGGINWDVNKHLMLNATVVNFLNQTGAKGTISGSELKTKEEIEANPQAYKNVLMTGSYIRPLTIEFSATIKF
ncbi:TonB-dependent receptor [Apibacter muscae]|uniref:TonB-dependent receptor n=1 Tax=Apibacter muscae TaxID=2509004 RepID=UPI0011AC2590|nr:TonB-dependent receptor [Apibacter muscae]TWP24721.1 TonB-dependent receptor [Apibacter muscae]